MGVERTRAIAAVTAVVGLAGVAAGSAVTGGEDEPQRAAPAGARAAAAPTLPDPWRRVGGGPPLAGFGSASSHLRASSEGTGELLVDVTSGPISHRSLLPEQAARLAGLDARVDVPGPSRIGGREVLVYSGLRGLGGAGPAIAVALPTTEGAVNVVCRGADARAPVEWDCWRAVDDLDLGGARALSPRPETALLWALPGLMDDLNRERAAGREALAAARTPALRAAAARRLAAAHRAAHDRLAPLAAGAGTPMPAALAAVADRYAALARAEAGRRTAAVRHAGARIRAAEQRLDGLLRRFEQRS